MAAPIMSIIDPKIIKISLSMNKNTTLVTKEQMRKSKPFSTKASMVSASQHTSQENSTKTMRM